MELNEQHLGSGSRSHNSACFGVAAPGRTQGGQVSHRIGAAVSHSSARLISCRVIHHHHAVWDKIGGTQTTHEDLVRAMQGYAEGGVVDDTLSQMVTDPQAAEMLNLDLAKLATMQQPVRMAGGGDPVEAALKLAQNVAKVGARERSAAGKLAAEHIKNQPPMKMSEALGNLNMEGFGKLISTQADRTRVGGGNIGGAAFPAISAVDPNYAGKSWGVFNQSAASGLINQSSPSTVWSTTLGGADQLKSNPIVFAKLEKAFRDSMKAGNLSPELEAKLNQNLGVLMGEPADIRDPEFWKSLNTFDKRAGVAQLMMGEGFDPKKGGVALGGEKSGKGVIFNPSEILKRETEPTLMHPQHGGDVPTFAVGPRLFTMGQDTSYRPDLHPGFPTLIHGEDLGYNVKPVPTEIALPDWHERFKALNPNRSPSYYDINLPTKGQGLPSQDIHEDYLSGMQKRGFAGGGAVKDPSVLNALAAAKVDPSALMLQQMGVLMDSYGMSADEAANVLATVPMVPAPKSEPVQHFAEGGSPQDTIDQAVLDTMRYDLAHQPTLTPTTDLSEQINNARLMAARANEPNQPVDDTDYHDSFGVNAKPASVAYANYDVPRVNESGQMMGLPKTAYDLSVDKYESQLAAGRRPEGMTDLEWAQDQAGRGRGGGHMLKALGDIMGLQEHVTGSSMGIDPMLGLIGQTGVAHNVPGAGRYMANRTAQGLREADRIIDEAHASGLLPQPGMSIKSVGDPNYVLANPDLYPKGSPEFRAAKKALFADKYADVNKPRGETAPPRETVPAPVSQMGFYSPAEQASLNLERKSGTGQAFVNDLLAGEHVTPEELDWMKLPEYLKNKPNATREDVQRYIAQNKIELGEVSYGDNRDHEADPVHIEHSMPGGENYREVVLTMPDMVAKRRSRLMQSISGMDSFIRSRVDMVNSGDFRSDLLKKDLPNWIERLNSMKTELAGMDEPRAPYTGGHFDDPNVLLHLRLKDFTDAEGKRMLLVDELQSDWHQQGKARGYGEAAPEQLKPGEWQTAMNQMRTDLADKIVKEQPSVALETAQKIAQGLPHKQVAKMIGREAEYTTLMEKQEADRLARTNPPVPNAPFKDTWHELGLKRAIKEAVDGGYDRVAITTGERQASRYDLSKQVDKIVWNPTTGDLAAQRVNGEGTIKHSNVNEKNLADYIGKSAAKKLLEAKPTSGWHMIEGDDLKAGGEGMRRHYDQVYPSFLKKFAKKYGATVGETKIKAGSSFGESDPGLTAHELKAKYGQPGENMQAFMQRMKNEPHQEPVHYMDITPSMREAVKAGLPYKKGGVVHMAKGGDVNAMRRELANPETEFRNNEGRYPTQFKQAKTPKVVTAHASALVPTQDDFKKKTIKKYIQHPSDKKPDVVLDGKTGKFLIVDGHHRILADFSRGEDKIPVRVIGQTDLDSMRAALALGK